MQKNMNFYHHAKSEKLSLTNLVFSDDVLLFSRGDTKFVELMMEILHTFSKFTGLGVNPRKCRLYLEGLKRVLRVPSNKLLNLRKDPSHSNIWEFHKLVSISLSITTCRLCIKLLVGSIIGTRNFLAIREGSNLLKVCFVQLLHIGCKVFLSPNVLFIKLRWSVEIFFGQVGLMQARKVWSRGTLYATRGSVVVCTY